MNGDGLPDFVVAFQGRGRQRVLDTYLNTGAGWVRKQAWSMPYMFWTYTAARAADRSARRRERRRLPRLRARVRLERRTSERLDTWLNSRQGLPAERDATPAYAPPTPIWSYGPDLPETRATFADLDGDGLADLVKAIRTGDTTTRESHMNRGTLGDRVVSIRDGLGAITRDRVRAAHRSRRVRDRRARRPIRRAP